MKWFEFDVGFEYYKLSNRVNHELMKFMISCELISLRFTQAQTSYHYLNTSKLKQL